MATDHALFEQNVLSFFSTISKTSFHQAHCIFCSSKKERVELFTKDSMRVVRCKCGFVYNENQATHEALNTFYKKSCAMQTWGELKQSKREDIRQASKFSKAVDYIKGAKIKSILDIGCGTGKFLSLLPKNINKVGIDSHPQSIEYAKKLGVNARRVSIDKYLNSFTDDIERLDAVSMWGVLEHFKEVKCFINSSHRILADKGKIIICVPNVDSLVVRTLRDRCFTFCPQHLWYFNLSTLIKLLERHKFKVVAHWTIEDEALPVLRHRMLLDPYKLHPYWLNLNTDKLAEQIIQDF